MREAEVQFINYLGVKRKVSASIQTQALNAIAFHYRDVLVIPLGEIAGLNRVQHHKRISVVMTASEVSAVLAQMTGTTALMAKVAVVHCLADLGHEGADSPLWPRSRPP